VTDAAGDRPQDVGRKHRKGFGPSVETEAILERYRAAMRLELDDLLVEIRPAAGQLTIDGGIERPGLDRRRALWELAIKIGRELGSAPDPIAPAELEPRADHPARRARPAPRLTVAARRQLGGAP